jgi:hypothetical protein
MARPASVAACTVDMDVDRINSADTLAAILGAFYGVTKQRHKYSIAGRWTFVSTARAAASILRLTKQAPDSR